MKIDEKWLQKSLENLERDIWPSINPDAESHLVRTCNRLRKIKLKDFETEDLRIMISQDIGLKHLLPLVFSKLSDNILAEGDFYPGDLLVAVLSSEEEFWQSQPDYWKEVIKIIDNQIDKIKKEEVSFEMKREWYEKIERFKKILS